MATSDLTHQQIPVGDSLLHIVEAGQDHPESLIFLHGWPEEWIIRIRKVANEE